MKTIFFFDKIARRFHYHHSEIVVGPEEFRSSEASQSLGYKSGPSNSNSGQFIRIWSALISRTNSNSETILIDGFESDGLNPKPKYWITLGDLDSFYVRKFFHSLYFAFIFKTLITYNLKVKCEIKILNIIYIIISTYV